jgi:hypothetical protein
MAGRLPHAAPPAATKAGNAHRNQATKKTRLSSPLRRHVDSRAVRARPATILPGPSPAQPAAPRLNAART